MKTIPLLVLGLLIIGASATHGGVPKVTVTISDADSKLAYEGSTSVSGTFHTGNLSPGNYVVQFRSEKTAMQGNQYLLVVSAGKKKLIADALRGERFAGGGLAMRFQVGKASSIEGQLVSERGVSVSNSPNERVIDGRRYLWVENETGSNLGPHWMEEGVASARNLVRIDRTYLQHLSDHAGEGSLLDRHAPSVGYH